MRLYFQLMKLLVNKFIFKKSNGVIVKEFAEKMGIVYIKLAQILATQNYDKLFTEEDRELLMSICDDCNPIEYEEIEKLLKKEYGDDLSCIFRHIDREPVGSASISQVHRAILNNGEEVAVKIKRRDITEGIENEINRIRKLVKRFGFLIKFKNILGGDYALDKYLEWIQQEVDFEREKTNIEAYRHFVANIDGKVRGTCAIHIPKLYEEYSGENIIVMEFIRTKTINQLELTEENKALISTALNSYIKSSFYALFYGGGGIVFHGDPHGGNVCVDEEGNITFLDMGLIFSMSSEESMLCLEFFLTAYSGNYEKLYNMLIVYGNLNEKQKSEFLEDCKKYTRSVKGKDVTNYFVAMIEILFAYELIPPEFLFGMAKVFLCLNGINKFTNNSLSAEDLLQEQVLEFLIKRSWNDCKTVVASGLNILPAALTSVVKNGFSKTMAGMVGSGFEKDCKRMILDLLEAKRLILSAFKEDIHSLPPQDASTGSKVNKLHQKKN